MIESFTAWVFTAIKVLILFGAAIFVHEYGHYWMARKMGLVVQGFAIGFGPRIFSWMRDGVEWSLRWIPAGGFVKLPQMITSEAIEGRADAPYPPASASARILVAVAGPAMNILFAFVLATIVWWVGLPVPVNPSIIGFVDPKSAEYQVGIREGDRIVSVNDRLVRSWQDVQQITALARTNVLPVVIERNGAPSTYQLTATNNPQVGFKLLNLDPRDHPVIVQVMPNSAAEQAGLKVDDQFISFAGVAVVGQAQLVDLIQKRPGVSQEVEIMRAGQRLKLKVTPRVDPETNKGRIGVLLSPSKITVYTLQKPGPTPIQNVTGVLSMMKDHLTALVHSKQTGVGAKDMSGPVGIFGLLLGEMKADFRLALNFMVLLNLNLAILNLLPIPVLDGGHILMALYEIVTRRRVSLRFQEYATSAFFLLIMSFMAYVTFFDVTKRLPLFRSLLRQETVIESPARTSPPSGTPPIGTAPAANPSSSTGSNPQPAPQPTPAAPTPGAISTPTPTPAPR